MKALLIAGGFGTRLRPLTYTRPKHLLPIANRPHLHHVFDLLQRHGIDEVILLTSYLAENFESSIAHARDRGMSVEVAHEDVPLGTAGALKNAENLIGDDTFFAFNGDVLTDMDLDAVLGFHRSRRAEATIVLTPVDDPSAFGVVPTEEDGRVLGFIEKPPPGEAPTDLINAGVYVFEPTVLGRIPAGQEYSAERALFPGLVEEGAELFAVGVEAFWADIGTPEKYLAANLDALRGAFRTDAVASPGDYASVFGDRVTVADGAQVSSACLGSGTELGAGSHVSRSVLMSDVKVGTDAVVVDSVLGEGVRVAGGARIEGRTVADAEEIGR